MGLNVSVVGSRVINNQLLLNNVLDILKSKYGIDSITTGDASGVDALGRTYALDNDITLTVIKADWDKFGKSAGMIRNKDIVNPADIVVALWDEQSSGTKNSIMTALKAMKNVVVFTNNGTLIKGLTNSVRTLGYDYYNSRVVKRGEPYYECSSKGHTEYSALYAKVNGVSIEEIYQLDIKGYRGKVSHWKEAKGEPTLNDNKDSLYEEYIKLWQQYFKNNIELYNRILVESKDKTITDMFGVRPVNQARAICDLCNNGFIY